MFNISDTSHQITENKALGILIKKPSNIFYMTNFSGEGYVYFTGKGEIILYADGRYWERAYKECFDNVKIIKIKRIYKDIAADILKRNILEGETGIKHNRTRAAIRSATADAAVHPAVPFTDSISDAFPAVMFESDYITYDEYVSFKKEFKAKINLIASAGVTSKIRSIKDKSELNSLLEAVSIAEESILDALRTLTAKNYFTESDLASVYKKNLIERRSRESFETITLSGKNSSLPHGMPSDEAVNKTGVLLCDFGAERNGYKSDETFTIHFGNPDGKFLDVYDTVYSAQQKAISEIKPGVKFSRLDKIARDYIDKRGYGKYFTHSLGHGVGLDIHEYPYVSKNNGDTVKEGMVFTVEPGVYIEGEFGVRIEDMCYVEKEGARVITGIKKNRCKIEDLF